jgi:hypothetical protein
MRPAQGQSPWAGADKRNQPRGLLTRCQGDHAFGGKIVGGYRTREPQRCKCCRCRICRRGSIYEVLGEAQLDLEVCADGDGNDR